MISHKHQYIFIHIPKCGGTSVESCLLNFEGVKRPKRLSLLPQKTKDEYHLNSGVKGHAFLKEIDLTLKEKYFAFTFVRNPFDKIVSEYLWDPQFNNLTFVKFLQTQAKWQIRHSNTQYEFIDEHIDFIGKFENLQQDFNVACDQIGIQQQDLPHRNKTKRKHYTQYYNNETRKIVAELHAKDLEYFGYKFGD